jgi:hypothetical protein
MPSEILLGKVGRKVEYQNVVPEEGIEPPTDRPYESPALPTELLRRFLVDDHDRKLAACKLAQLPANDLPPRVGPPPGRVLPKEHGAHIEAVETVEDHGGSGRNRTGDIQLAKLTFSR